MKRIFLILLGFLPVTILAQNWESPILTSIPGSIIMDGDYKFRYSIAADNFGLHFVGQFGNPAMSYYLLSNTGTILQQINNVNLNPTACSICSYNGTVYVALTTSSQMKLYAKTNVYPLTNFADLAYYNISPPSVIKYIDMCADNYGIHIVFSVESPQTGAAAIYYLNYKIESNSWADYSPAMVTIADPNPPGPGGWAGRLCTSNVNGTERVHFSFGSCGNFYTRDMEIFRNPDSKTLHDAQSTNDWGRTYDIAAWGTLAADPRPNGLIYELGMLFSMQGSYDSKLKHKQIGPSTNWDNSYVTNQIAGVDFKYPETMFYDDYLGTGPYLSVMYGRGLAAPYSVYQRYYDIAAQNFQAQTYEVFHGTSSKEFTSGVMKRNQQGVLALGNTYEYPSEFWMNRLPRSIKSNIDQNTLWTGSISLDAPNSPYIHTNGASIDALSGSSVTLSSGTQLILDANNYFKMYYGSHLNLGNNSRLIVKTGSWFASQCESVIQGPTSGTHALIVIYPGSNYCRQGYRFAFVDEIFVRNEYDRVITFNPCLGCDQDGPFCKDSSTVIIDSNTTLQIPDDYTMNIVGQFAKLQMNPGSVLQMGQNSKLVLQDGAHIYANNAAFTSSGFNSTWDGIYLSGSNDTILNCTISNAQNGINILDKVSTGIPQRTTEITSCTFIDSSNTQLTNGIFVSNSNNVLIRNCNFTSTPLVDGFVTGVLMQYCPAGNIDVIDNTITNSQEGICVIQSSPYIARNTITGSTENGTGIYLDNANGTVKYNTVNNFSNSYKSFYSSPYLLKNTFSNASYRNIDLLVNSLPLMQPINSGSELMWLSGNNYVSGYPSSCGVGFSDGSCPIVDSGFNNFTLNGSNYFSGMLIIPELPAEYNYWQDRPPVQNKFDVTNGDVDANPDYDGSTLPSTTGYELTDIGFGLYDTVYVESLGDSPGADNLYSQAYRSEVTGQYLTAISQYKQVVTDYKTSDKAPAAIARIINCLEKKIATLSEYSQLQTYMSQIRDNNTFPIVIRRLAEDFVLKTMVRQNMFLNSINNYDSMYQHNIGNNKGAHALLNKLSLTAMDQEIMDGPGNSQGNITQSKLSLLSVITGNQLSMLHVNQSNQFPKEFKLYQNYPNPFNPITKIKYDLPKEGMVSLKIYDLIGKEIYSANEYKLPGTYEFTFDGSKYASGVYFYRIDAGKFTSVKKMVLVK